MNRPTKSWPSFKEEVIPTKDKQRINVSCHFVNIFIIFI